MERAQPMKEPKAETAKEIARILAAVAKRADDAGFGMLAYLACMAETEARSEEAKATGSPPTAD